MKRWLLVALLSCSRKTTPPPPAPVVASASAAPEAGPSLEARLRRYAVTDDDFARRVLYTWTQPAQIDRLRKTPTLLTATAYEGFGPSRFVLDLEDRIREKKDPDAQAILMHPRLARRRYAWVAPFATRISLSKHPYGDALIKVVLKDTAHLAHFDPEAGAMRFVDINGKPVEKLDPSRLAAVYHVRKQKTATEPFREYVLCNEEQIASWSWGTDDIRAELDEEKALLRQLPDMPVVPAWNVLTAEASLSAIWHAAIAFDTEAYQPKNIPALVTALDGYNPTPPAFSHSAM
jgi:hypothetical protein